VEKPEIITTERLVLRSYEPGDMAAVHYNLASDPDVVSYMSYSVCGSLDKTKKMMDEWIRYFSEAVPGVWGLFVIVIKETGDVVGTIDYAETDCESRSAEVGFQLGKAWWGAGYAAEALRALITYCFETVGLDRIWADYDTRNPNSGRVMQKAGMLYVGTSRQGRIDRGDFISRSLYAIRAEDYQGKSKVEVTVVPYDRKYRDDMLFCYLTAKDAIGRYAPKQWSKPTLKDDLLDIDNSYIERGEVFYLAIDERDRVVGMIGTLAAAPGELWLKRLFVMPDKKGKGIGGMLLAAVEEYAVSRGVTAIHTRFAHWYREASVFYPAKGFVDSKEDEHFRIMVKYL